MNQRLNKKTLTLGAIVIVILVVTFFVLTSRKKSIKPSPVNTQQATLDKPEEVVEQEPNTAQIPSYDLTTPSSITFIANKTRPLPASYEPTDLITPDVKLRLGAGAEQMQFRNVAHADIKEMFTAAKNDGVTLVFGSGYRSYSLQKQFYDGYVARDGVAAADSYSARPGTSEHQTGLSFDATSVSQTCHLEICFENTTEGKWLAANAHEYGFVLRYPNGKEAITGYQYEPWHFRYLGLELASKINTSEKTVEEFFELN